MKLSTATLALVACLAIPAAAEAQRGQERFRQFCTGDYMRLCSQFPAESREVRQCFIANMRSLSPGCRQAIAASPRKGRRHGRRRR